MAEFVFLNLPQNYRLVDALAAGKTDFWWRTTRLHDRIRVGDTVFLWQGAGNASSLRGLHAIGNVVERPRLLQPEEFDEFWVNEGEKGTADEHTRIRVREAAPKGRQLRQETILASKLLSPKGVFNGAQGVNFNLSTPEAQELRRLWDVNVGPFLPRKTAPTRTATDRETRFDGSARQQVDAAAATLLQRSLTELKTLLAKPVSAREGRLRPIIVAGWARDPAVVAYARLRAGQRCEVEGCSNPLFLTGRNQSYVEVHHIKPLAEGGADTVGNVACLCPSHHREAHHGVRAGLIQAELRKLRENG